MDLSGKNKITGKKYQPVMSVIGLNDQGLTKRFVVSSLEHIFAKKLAENGKHVDFQHNSLFKIHCYDQLRPGKILLDSKYFLKSECRNAIRLAYLKNISNKFHFLKVKVI